MYTYAGFYLTTLKFVAVMNFTGVAKMNLVIFVSATMTTEYFKTSCGRRAGSHSVKHGLVGALIGCKGSAVFLCVPGQC